MISALCPHCGTDDVEYIGTDSDDDEYICCDCQNTFIVNWEEVGTEQNNNGYPDEYFEGQTEEGFYEDEEEQY